MAARTAFPTNSTIPTKGPPKRAVCKLYRAQAFSGGVGVAGISLMPQMP